MPVMPLARFNCRVYSVLLLLYPRALRRQFGEEMIEVFAEQIRDACRRQGWIGGLAVWRCVCGEALRAVVVGNLQLLGISLVSSVTALGLLCIFFWFTTGHS